MHTAGATVVSKPFPVLHVRHAPVSAAQVAQVVEQVEHTAMSPPRA